MIGEETVKGVDGIVRSVGNIIDDIHTSDEERMKAELGFSKLYAKVAEKQMDINKVEAAHSSIFVAGWRPMIGWIGAVALAWHFILQPIAEVILAIAGVNIPLPKIDYQPLFTLIMGMLGVGAMRSYDKMRGTDTKSILVRNKVGGMSDGEIKKEAEKWVR